MVTVAEPAVAVELAARVSVLVAVAELGEKVAVTPVGRPVAESATEPVKPFCGVTLMVVVPLPPCATVSEVGEEASVKLAVADAATVTVTVVLAVKLPDVPLIVTVEAPGEAVEPAVSVSVPVLVVGFGEKVAVTPVGRPVAEKVTEPVKPFSGVTAIVVVPLPP